MRYKRNKILTAFFISSFSLSAWAQPALEEIVVTATKRETNLIDTPISMSVVSDNDLKQRHVQSLMDLSDGSVPGLNIAPFESRQSALTVGIRGIVPLDANQPAREQGVGVYIDGIYLGRQHGLNASLLDLERIEVLKGPQGTLFGRNTEGGALSMVTKKPTGEFDVRLNSGAGNYNSNSADFHINLPNFLGVSTKIDAITQYQDATTKNPLAGETGWNYQDRNGIRITNRIQTDTITLDYTFDQGTDKSTPFYSQLLNYNPLNLSITPLPAMVKVNGSSIMKVADIGVPQQPSVAETGGHGINLTWNISDLLEFRSLTAYRFVDSTQWDNAGGAHRVPVAKANGVFSRYSISELNQTQFSQEFQLVGSTSSIDYVTGLYYFIEDASEWAATPSTNTWNSTLTGYTINDAMLWQPGNMFIDRDTKATSESSAIFGQVVYTPEFLEKLHLTLGGRHTQDDKKGVLEKVRNIQANLPFEESSTRFNPLAIISYEVKDNINTYIKYATGYRSGGASSRSLTFRSFGPEDNISYEIGMKGDFFNRVRINTAAYTMERTGSQIDFSQVAYDPVTKSSRNTLETMNAPGITKIKGLEIDSTIAITENLVIKGAYTYTNTLVPDTINPFKNQLQPVFIVFTPENVYNLAIDYTTYFDNFSVVAHIDANASDAAHAFSEFEL